jgi:NAD(P)H-binding
VSRSTSRSRNEFATSVARTSPPQRLIASSSSVFKSQRRAFGFGRFLFGALREQKENIKSMEARVGCRTNRCSNRWRLYDDKDVQEWIIRRSKLDWVIVRPVILTDGPKTNAYRALADPRS